jgi:phosphoribosyl 1,2-cyclic phosphodiesterase
MKFVLLGTGGAIPTPRIFCQCKMCNLARRNIKFRRNHCCAAIPEEKILIDCPEDIGDSLNKHSIKEIEHVFITHTHLDHIGGLRILLDAHYDFLDRKPIKKFKIYISAKLFENLKKDYPKILEYMDKRKLVEIILIRDDQEILIGKVKVKAISYEGTNSDWYAFVFQNKEKILYCPCDTLMFKNYLREKKVDTLVQECGILSSDKVKSEISFEDMISRINEMEVKRTVLTHIEEVEIFRWGQNYLQKLVKENKDNHISIGQDGQIIFF